MHIQIRLEHELTEETRFIFTTIFAAIIGGVSAQILAYLQNKAKRDEEFRAWFRSYYLDQGVEVLLIYLSKRHHPIPITETQGRNLSELPSQALLRVSSLLDMRHLYDMFSNAHRMDEFNFESKFRSGGRRFLMELQFGLAAIHRELTLDVPHNSAAVYDIHSKKCITQHRRHVIQACDDFMPIMTQELAETAQMTKKHLNLIIELTAAIQKASAEDREPLDDEIVKELAKKIHDLNNIQMLKFNRQNIASDTQKPTEDFIQTILKELIENNRIYSKRLDLIEPNTDVDKANGEVQ